MRNSDSRGMSLIELLLVLLIMALLVGVSVVSIDLPSRLAGGNARDDRHQQAGNLAAELTAAFNQAAALALAGNQVLGWSYAGGGGEDAEGRESGEGSTQDMIWWQWTAQRQWQHSKTLALPTVRWPENIRVQQQGADSRRWAQSDEPMLIFLPGREYMAFEIELRARGSGRTLAAIWSQHDGYLHWAWR